MLNSKDTRCVFMRKRTILPVMVPESRDRQNSVWVSLVREIVDYLQNHVVQQGTLQLLAKVSLSSLVTCLHLITRRSRQLFSTNIIKNKT